MEKPALTIKNGNDLAISVKNLQGLMQEVLEKGAMFKFQAKGWSMSPFIRNGDRITIAPLNKEKLTVGKVVAFIQPASGRLVVHRVIDKRGAAFLIRGDNATGEPDGWILPKDILGCVICVERGRRRVYLGFGPERSLMAFLTRNGWLTITLKWLRSLKSTVIKR